MCWGGIGGTIFFLSARDRLPKLWEVEHMELRRCRVEGQAPNGQPAALSREWLLRNLSYVHNPFSSNRFCSVYYLQQLATLQQITYLVFTNSHFGLCVYIMRKKCGDTFTVTHLVVLNQARNKEAECWSSNTALSPIWPWECSWISLSFRLHAWLNHIISEDALFYTLMIHFSDRGDTLPLH